MTVSRDGYLQGSVEATVVAGVDTQVAVPLVREPKDSPVKIALSSGKQPVGGRVRLQGPSAVELAVTSADGGSALLPRGHYVARVDADGYLSRMQQLDVAEQAPLSLTIELVPRAKANLLALALDELVPGSIPARAGEPSR